MSDKKRVLFITYFFETTDGVGAHRLSYWAKNIARLSVNAISCDVITSKYDQSLQHEGIDNIFCISDEGKPMFNLFVKDQGYAWKRNIVEFLLNGNDNRKYDTVLLSGGPFMQFLLVPFLKKQYNCRVILDFRDPFANNPRFHNGWIKRMIKGHYESLFIKNADTVITINKTCSKLLSVSTKNASKMKIIDNGYDEVVIDSVVQQNRVFEEGKIHFVYPGKFYPDASPSVFLNIISNSNNYSFSYVGTESSEIAEFEGITNHGAKNYQDTIGIIHSSNVGLIFTGGKPFESTTKIFDYIGLEKAILIITNGEERTGNLHEITSDYPGVFWSENDETSIQNILEEIKSSNLNVNYPDRDNFSRKAGLMKLLELI